MSGFVHILRIDADDGQAALLGAIGLPALRPWIVVVRAGEPDCDALIEQAGYRFVLFDGLNRFFLAPEQAARASRLAAPAHAGDGFLRAADAATAGRLASAEAALAVADARIEGRGRRLLDAVRSAGQTRSELTAMSEGAAWLRGLVDEMRDSDEKLRAQIEWLQAQLATAKQERLEQLLARTEEAAWLRQCLADAEARIAAERREAAAQAEAAAAQASATLDGLYGSLSWRLTRPLRRLARPQKPVPPPPTPPPPSLPPPAEPPAPRPAEPVTPHAPPVEASPPPTTSEDPPRAATRPDAPGPPSGQALAAVHQFHAGSAKGDAITNAMLLIRSLLRQQGFVSEVFVETRGAGLEEDAIHLLEALPDTSGYVLLVHHSIGYPSFDRIMALPVRKVLVYHNITPPEFLHNVPRIEGLARLGREQLAAMCGQMAFALAVSDYNAGELRALGYPAVRTCPLLLDVAAIQQRAVGVRPGDGVFTVLFVGRMTPSKAQDDLVDAFAVFHARFAHPCRLVLVGALDPDEHLYLARLEARIAAAGLEGAVLLTGLVSDEELHSWYRQADLYVSLSRHEGFGVPLVEAMAHGVPVLAWPSGAVPYTLGGAGTLLTSREPAAVADAMLAIVPHGREEGARGAASLDRFALARGLPVLMEALDAAEYSA